MAENGLENGVQFGENYEPLPESESYYPSRYEYMAGKALQGLCVGRAEKYLRNVPKLSLELADEMEKLLDSAQG